MKVAVTERDWAIVTVQVSLPEQSPDQPSNVDMLSGVAVSVTVSEARNPAVHGVSPVGPVHEIPSGSEVTVPTPSTLTLNVPPLSKVAVTERTLFIETMQVLIPLHAPLHPVNTWPDIAVAVNVTEVVASKICVHAVPFVGPSQSMPTGSDVTLPFPTTSTESMFSVANVARTFFDSVIKSVHRNSSCVHPPLHPPN